MHEGSIHATAEKAYATVVAMKAIEADAYVGVWSEKTAGLVTEVVRLCTLLVQRRPRSETMLMQGIRRIYDWGGPGTDDTDPMEGSWDGWRAGVAVLRVALFSEDDDPSAGPPAPYTVLVACKHDPEGRGFSAWVEARSAGSAMAKAVGMAKADGFEPTGVIIWAAAGHLEDLSHD